MGATPNNTLRAWRTSMRLSQDEFAIELRAAGARIGAPNDITKRTVQRWENGEIQMPRGHYTRALQALTGLPVESLGFPPGVDAVVVDDGRGGHDLEVRASALTAPGGTARPPRGNYSGVWLSRYEFYSSSRGSAFTAQHHAVLLQHGDRLAVRSVPGSADSTMAMDLTLDASVITGTWVDETNPNGHYRGARYHGAIQLLVEPTGRRMTGKWVGFGKDHDVNTGPWTLIFLDASTSKATLDRYSRPPE